MDHEENRLREERHRRIRMIKRLMRPLPRRATVHRYPILKWFAGFARKRSYLWSFRVSNVTPALYAGCILTLLPLYGVQLAAAFGLALLFRANLPILVGFQFVSNPFTVVPIYYLCFQIGHIFLRIFGVTVPSLTVSQLSALIADAHSGEWVNGFEYLGKMLGVMTLGAAIMGTFMAAVLSVIYRVGAQRANAAFIRLKQIQEQRMGNEAGKVIAAPPQKKPKLFRKGRRKR